MNKNEKNLFAQMLVCYSQADMSHLMMNLIDERAAIDLYSRLRWLICIFVSSLIVTFFLTSTDFFWAYPIAVMSSLLLRMLSSRLFLILMGTFLSVLVLIMSSCFHCSGSDISGETACESN